MHRNSVFDNSAVEKGGGVFIISGDFTEINNLKVFENNAGYGGGMCPNLTDKTLYQRACAMVKREAPGGQMWRTIFWNLNGNSPGFPALKDTPNVQLVAGFSQSLFKLILVGSYETEVDPVTGKVTMKVDPWATFLKAISDPSLIPVLEVLSASTEGIMAHYTLPQAADE